MNLNIYRPKGDTPLIEKYYEVNFPKECLPFKTIIIPIAHHRLSFIKKGTFKVTLNNKQYCLNDTALSGPLLKGFQLEVKEEVKSFGINLHPSTLYKILNRDMSKLGEEHISLKELASECLNQLELVFNSNLKGENALKEYEKILQSASLHTDPHTENIDKAIQYIRKKEGLITVSELISEINVSQKTLETKFKYIIGMTPGKYIKLYRFITLMQKLESQEIKLKDLILMHNYYDESHFMKDFKYFMKKTVKDHFKKDNDMYKKYLEI